MQKFTVAVILVVVCGCVALDDPKSWPFADPNKFAVAKEDSESEELLVKPKWLYDLDGRPVAVFENVVSYKTVYALSVYQFLTNYWRYGTTLDPCNENDVADSNNAPWRSNHDGEVFAESAVGKAVQGLVMKMSGSSQPYNVYQVTDYVIRRGDVIKLHHDATREDREFSALIYLNEIWKKNYYGETMFYDNDEEIAAVVKPSFGRIVIWESSVDYLLRPPSINFKQGQRILHIKYTTNTTKVETHKAKRLAEIKAIKEATGEIFDHSDKPLNKQLDVQKHFVQEYKASDGRRIVVLDDLFDSKDLDELRSYTLKYGEYFYDESLDLESDNVQWIAGYEVDNYIQSRFWNITRQVMTFVTGKSEWFPYDVSCNLVRSADHTRIHHDCEIDEEEWTFLVYLNSNWTENYYGETAYFETNDDDTEYIAEVLPVYGRVAIHEGYIPHSARPPSSLYPGARLTFAVKMSVNEQTARIKGIMEKYRQEESLTRFFIPILNHFDDNDFEERLRERVIAVLKEDMKTQGQVHQEFDGDDDEDDDDDDDDEGEDRQEDGDENKMEREHEGEEEDGFELFDEDVPEADARWMYLTEKMKESGDDMTKLRALMAEVVKYGGKSRKDFAEKLQRII